MHAATAVAFTCAVLLAAAGAGPMASTGPEPGQQPAAAQQPGGRGSQGQRPLTAADYARAERFLAPNLNGLVAGGSVEANWLPDDRFWYRNQTGEGHEFILVTPSMKSRRPAFDHARLATALSEATGSKYSATDLPFQSIDLTDDGATVSFDLKDRRWSCDAKGTRCADVGEAARRPAGGGGRGGGRGGAATNTVTSPDGKRAVFIRDWNLWVRDLPAGQERQLTKDGVEYFGYATDNAGWRSSGRPIVLWSPDSTKVATFQQDERKVGEWYFVRGAVDPPGHPSLTVSKYPLPGDETVAMLHRVVIDVGTGEVVRFQMPPDYHRATLGDDVSVRDWQWKPDGSSLAFISTSRDHKEAVLRVADTATGAVRTVMEEKVATHYESRIGCHVLWDANEVIWYSQRDDWGHLYLYDLETGGLKNRITTGEGPVMQIVHVDEKARTVAFQAQGREPGEHPYFRHFYRIGLDGQGYVSLTPTPGSHSLQRSPSGSWLVDTSSTWDAEPAVALRDGDGRFVMMVEKANIAKLRATGWQPPIGITIKARDGKTDLYGLMFRPTTFDPSRKYPIVNQIYPGPQSGSTRGWTFAAARGDAQALAELGFIVVTIDGTGTPGRSKSFHDAYYGAMGRDNTIPDQIAGMKDLASRFPWIDLDRVGIWGHSGGGFATTSAMFRFPDFFKVGIAESGNHDQRLYEDDWGERYQGLLVKGADGKDSYDIEANQNVAKNLKGHLLLAHGTMDTNVPPENTLAVVDALIKANKDFDLLMIPNAGHGYGGASNYVMRRRWDYFVKWLLGVDPPKGYEIGSTRPPSAPREPTRADILRGAWGKHRANNDLLSYHLDVRVDPEKKHISGTNTIRFRMLSDDTRIQLDLSEALKVDRILLGAQELKYERELGALFVDFPETLRRGRTYAIDVRYSGNPAETGRFGGIAFRKDPAGRHWINTACQGTGASIWWPNKDQQRDEVENMRLSVSIPNDLVDVSNGKFLGKTDLGDGYTRWEWQIQYPINNYSVSLNIGHYTHFTGTAGDMTLDFYVLPESLEKARAQFAQVAPMIASFEKHFGEYPFKKDGYKLIEVPYSGMEHQSAVTYGNRFANGYLERDWTGVGVSTKFDFIIVHESAHEWFGNAITAADVADMWIHEGWGTYLEAIYVEDQFGYDDALKYVNGYKSKVRNREPIVTEPGINRTPSQDQYFKGALFLHTLRHVIDDDARWWALLREFYQEFKYRNIGTDDVVAFFNRKTRRNLTPIFDQYLRRASLPTLDLQFQDSGQVAYRWSADVKGFAMPVKVGRPGQWQVLRPTTDWQVMTTSIARDDFEVGTDWYYINVSRH
ncbi:MAG: DPP IV N-terminal domain-containing protein [Acidobacteriota bacterium]